MTIEERFARLEHYTAGLGEQLRREHDENRELWRESQREIARVERNLATLSDQFVRSQEDFLRFQREAAERSRELDERFRQTDERIQALVSSIGEWMRKTN